MPKTLIEELPRIAAEGRREAQQVLDRLSGGVQIGLQTNAGVPYISIAYLVNECTTPKV